jgi:hypothetical protein
MSDMSCCFCPNPGKTLGLARICRRCAGEARIARENGHPDGYLIVRVEMGRKSVIVNHVSPTGGSQFSLDEARSRLSAVARGVA